MATRGIINGSIINYQITFTVPNNTDIHAILIRDDLPEGLTYTASPGATWLGGAQEPALNVTPSEYIPAATDSVTPYKPSRVQMYITDTTITQAGGTFTINIPAKVMDADLLVANSPVKNEYTLYSTTDKTVTAAPAIAAEITSPTWIGASHSSDTDDKSNDTFTKFGILLNGGLIDVDNVEDTTTPDMSGCSFNILNSVESDEETSNFKYILTFKLDDHLHGNAADATHPITLFYLDGETVRDLTVGTDEDYTVTLANDEITYTITIPVTDKVRGKIINVFVPFGLKTAIKDVEFNTGNPYLLRNPLTLEVKDSQTTATTVIGPVEAAAEVRVAKGATVISFGGKSLN